MNVAAKPRRIASSTKIALGFILLVSAVVFGWRSISSAMIDGVKFDELEPDRVNILGIRPGSGYFIIVANQVAQLVQGETGGFDAPTDLDARSAVGDRKRIPLREMLNAMKGDEKALGEFIRVMNNLREPDMPANQIWKAEDIEKALAGDSALKAKLIRDLSVDFEGNPASSTTAASLENGIGISLPVSVEVNVGASPKKLVGRVVVEYRPTFTAAVWKHLEQKFDQGKEQIAGYWREELLKLKERPESREDVALSLRSQIAESRRSNYAKAPSQVLANAKIVITSREMVKAQVAEGDIQDGERQFQLTIDLTDEGRKRLWQFSKRRVGDQLLLLMDGIAIAAPRIEHELAQGEVTINRLHDESLVREVTELINTHGGDGKK